MLGGIAPPAKALEDAVELLRRNTDALIGDAHPNLSIVTRYSDFYLAFGTRITHGVVQQDHEELAEPRRITIDEIMRRAVGVADPHRFGVGNHLGVAADLLKQIAEVDEDDEDELDEDDDLEDDEDDDDEDDEDDEGELDEDDLEILDEDDEDDEDDEEEEEEELEA